MIGSVPVICIIFTYMVGAITSPRQCSILRFFSACKTDKFQMKNGDICLIFVKTWSIGTRQKRCIRAVLTNSHNL